MQRPFYLDASHRNEYLVFMLNVLDEKYFVNRSKLARGIGLSSNYLADFVDGRRKLRTPNLDKIEIFINDLYGAIIEEEWEINSFYFNQLSTRSKETVRK